MASPGPTDASLLGDHVRPSDTFSLFYRRHARGVLAFCAREGLGAQDAADSTADIFVAALTGRYRFADDHAGSPMAWLYGIAANVVTGRHRCSALERAAQDHLQRHQLAASVHELADYAELRADVATALAHIDALPDPQRQAMLDRHLGDVPYAELAHRQGVSEQAVRQRVSRARSVVREQMATS